VASIAILNLRELSMFPPLRFCYLPLDFLSCKAAKFPSFVLRLSLEMAQSSVHASARHGRQRGLPTGWAYIADPTISA
jgi:hypothetical protein